MASDSQRVVIAGALVLGMVVGILVTLLLDQSDEEETQRRPATEGSAFGPMEEVNGVPVGYARTEEGAIAAATNFNLLAGRDDLFDPEALARATQTLAAPSWEDQAAAQAKNGYEYIANTYGVDADITSSVVRYGLRRFSPENAAVQLWTVSLASGPRRPNVEEVWALVRVDLQWIDGDWRVTGFASEVGPAPVDLPSRNSAETASDLMENLSEFRRPPLP